MTSMQSKNEHILEQYASDAIRSLVWLKVNDYYPCDVPSRSKVYCEWMEQYTADGYGTWRKALDALIQEHFLNVSETEE